MNADSLKAAQEAFAATIGYQPDLNTPITQAEATALRDRHKSMMNMLSGLQEHIAKLDNEVQSLRSRADDADETAKQLRSLAARVGDMAEVQKDLLARLKVTEEKLGIVHFNEESIIVEEPKPKAKKK